eukprot:371044_1
MLILVVGEVYFIKVIMVIGHIDHERRRLMDENISNLQLSQSNILGGILFGLIVICGVWLSYYRCKIEQVILFKLILFNLNQKQMLLVYDMRCLRPIFEEI